MPAFSRAIEKLKRLKAAPPESEVPATAPEPANQGRLAVVVEGFKAANSMEFWILSQRNPSVAAWSPSSLPIASSLDASGPINCPLKS